MVNKEVINVLHRIQTFFGKEHGDNEYLQEAIDIAIQALEKQMPLETDKTIHDNEEPAERCPICGTFVFGKYCYNCGQKLKESEQA